MVDGDARAVGIVARKRASSGTYDIEMVDAAPLERIQEHRLTFVPVQRPSARPEGPCAATTRQARPCPKAEARPFAQQETAPQLASYSPH